MEADICRVASFTNTGGNWRTIEPGWNNPSSLAIKTIAVILTKTISLLIM